MADLTMPQRQTYPTIRGSVSDEIDLLPLETAEQLTLILEPIAGGDGFELPAVALDPPEEFLLNGATVLANFEAAIDAGMSDDVAELRGKLRIDWDLGDGLVQYAPQEDFITITITQNVVEA